MRCLKQRDLRSSPCRGTNSQPELKYAEITKFNFEEEPDYGLGVPNSPKDFYNSEIYDEIVETEIFSITPRPTGTKFHENYLIFKVEFYNLKIRNFFRK